MSRRKKTCSWELELESLKIWVDVHISGRWLIIKLVELNCPFEWRLFIRLLVSVFTKQKVEMEICLQSKYWNGNILQSIYFCCFTIFWHIREKFSKWSFQHEEIILANKSKISLKNSKLPKKSLTNYYFTCSTVLI